MKRTLLTLLFSVCVLCTLQAKSKNVFPDGTPIDKWFLKAEIPALSELGQVYHIGKFGAESSTEKVQTELIQSVIDKAAETGGVVYIPEGIYKSGALYFKQGTHLYLAKGAVLMGSESIFDFPLTMTRIEGEVCKYFPALINVIGLDGFTISGEGTIDGNGSDYWRAFRLRRQWNPKCTNKDEMRPRLVHVAYSKNIQFSGVAMQNSPFWTCHCYKSEFLQMIGLRIFSPIEPIRSASADGIDLDACQNVLVKNCRITVNDDAVCLKGGKGPYADQDSTNGPCKQILIEDCHFDHTTGSALTCGSESIHVRNVLMRNCRLDGASHLVLFKMRPDTPQIYEFLTIENISGHCNRLFEASAWKQFFDLKSRPDIPKTYCRNVTLKDLSIKCKQFIRLSRNDEQYEVLDITFKNISVQAQDIQRRQDAFNGVVFDDVHCIQIEAE